MKTYTIFEKCSASAYYDFITSQINQDAEAAYYLLTQRLSSSLRREYELHGFGLSDDFDDTIDDFFLYLYEGDRNELLKPFAMLGSIQQKGAFFGWVVSTYRNFLLKRAREEEKRKRLFPYPLLAESHSDLLSEEAMVTYLATAIAYADQQFTLRNRFVFYRLLLTFLDHDMAIPQEAMAKVLGMHPVTYRVSTKRQKERFLKLINEQEAGRTLPLDERHETMRDKIVKGFTHLYDVLLQFYDVTLNELPLADEIKALRRHYSGNDALLMHEDQPKYGFRYKLNVRQFYNNLKTAWSLRQDT